ncbi:5-carboxymethyl-2-hydroxymuconate isomerase [Noviherbaspirillum sp. CPCC 100848]|uniref:5-carboxymethyl-2-hydroxymuconate isomerase n=1 Tax=Noviherbaspirillum album TaxID=3080276 RepID=A0ABU6JEZ5_9BURK|nr:5-carboxymethyl-2-hydroxymuconate isomerase [Noviherbaspirillum sp. CPCC 100848]MEC4721782.1 5-carboxymethyl-2-hydroxymuconate isomerase [Noviherbaspirillum sp. CPCC 100848]
MPHIWIEHSANLEGKLDLALLLTGVHSAAVNTRMFAEGAIRTRLQSIDQYRIGDGHPDNAFVHVVIRIAAGRDLQTRKQIGETMFAELCRLLGRQFDNMPLGLSLEVQELDAALNFKQNNLQDHIDRRTSARQAG